MSSQPKRSLAAGISCLAEAGALFAGDVAGLEVTLPDPARLKDETRGAGLVWDDAEERRYRDWVKEKVQQSNSIKKEPEEITKPRDINVKTEMIAEITRKDPKIRSQLLKMMSMKAGFWVCHQCGAEKKDKGHACM